MYSSKEITKDTDEKVMDLDSHCWRVHKIVKMALEKQSAVSCKVKHTSTM